MDSAQVEHFGHKIDSASKALQLITFVQRIFDYLGALRRYLGNPVCHGHRRLLQLLIGNYLIYHIHITHLCCRKELAQVEELPYLGKRHFPYFHRKFRHVSQNNFRISK